MAINYEEWMRDVQAVEIELLGEEDHRFWRQQYDEAMIRGAEWREQAAPSRRSTHRDHRYAIAIEDDSGLGLTFWIRRSAKGEIFLLYPREPAMDPHASYHLDGTYHHKTYGMTTGSQKRQALDGSFQGAEHLGTFAGHGPGPRMRDLSHFDDVVVAPPGSLSGRCGSILVDLVAPGASPAPQHRAGVRIVAERFYRDASPWIAVAIATP